MQRFLSQFALFALALAASWEARAEWVPCQMYVDGSPKAEESIDVRLEEPELEAKLLVPSKRVFRQMRDLASQELVMVLDGGRRQRFRFEFDREHYYEDITYDTDPELMPLSLFRIGAMLRGRTRYDRRAGEREFRKRYHNFQAKDVSRVSDALDASVHARNEYRGERYRSRRLFERDLNQLLGPNSQDYAVAYARELLGGYAGSFVPMIEIRQRRFFMRLVPIDPMDEEVPSFFLSLDRVKYRSLVGRRGKATQLVAELELLDPLKEAGGEINPEQIDLLNQLSVVLQNRFGLEPTSEDKYSFGVRRTVL